MKRRRLSCHFWKKRVVASRHSGFDLSKNDLMKYPWIIFTHHLHQERSEWRNSAGSLGVFDAPRSYQLADIQSLKDPWVPPACVMPMLVFVEKIRLLEGQTRGFRPVTGYSVGVSIMKRKKQRAEDGRYLIFDYSSLKSNVGSSIRVEA